MKLEQRPADDFDIPFLLALRRETMDPHLLATGASTSEERHRDRLMHQFGWGRVLMLEGEPVGLLKVVREPPVWEIVQIQLGEKLRGRGIGGDLLRQVIAEAAASGCGTKLSVLKANPARHLYERLGFVTVSESEHEFFMLRSAA